MPQAFEGQMVVVQVADLVQSMRMIPDQATWCQCFAVYVAVLAKEHPERCRYGLVPTGTNFTSVPLGKVQKRQQHII